MQRRFSDLPQALAATQEIADRCRLPLPLGVPHYPEAAIESGASTHDASARLHLKAWQVLSKSTGRLRLTSRLVWIMS